MSRNVFISLALASILRVGTAGAALPKPVEHPPCEMPAASACLQNELRNLDADINAIYGSLLTGMDESSRTTLQIQQRKWLVERNALCRLDRVAMISQTWIQDLEKNEPKSTCVIEATRARIAELKNTLAGAVPPTADAASATQRAPDPYRITYDGHRVTTHTNGKWYFEVAVDRGGIAKIFPTDIIIGLNDTENVTGTAENVPPDDDRRGLVRIGIAADLDNGKLYVSRNGDWGVNTPGSNRGTDVKLGHEYYSIVMISAKSHNAEYFASGAIAPNFGGEKAMTYALPAGSLAWRDASSSVTATTEKGSTPAIDACPPPSGIPASLTPVELYAAVPRCIRKSEFETAAILFALGGLYGQFDASRVTDPSAGQAAQVLARFSLDSLTQLQSTAFQERLSRTVADTDGLRQLCTRLKQIGPPNYYPTYMIRHGMGRAMGKGDNDDGLLDSFDAKNTWEKTLATYMSCQ